MNDGDSRNGSFKTRCAGALRAALTMCISAVTLSRRLVFGVLARLLSATTCISSKGQKVSSQETQQPEPFDLSDEQLALHRHRYRAARRAGMSMRDSKLFASSKIDIEEMRRLAREGCPADLMLLILL